MTKFMTDCCESVSKLDFGKMEFPDLEINFTDCKLWTAILWILFNPLYWNLMARLEYQFHLLSRLCCSSRKFACFLLALSIIFLGIYRDMRFYAAVSSQPRWLIMQQNYILWFGHFLVLSGTALVITSYWRLGFFGTFLGDYFGMLLPEKVTGFPFNIMENPMYWGSTANFLGFALVHSSQTGLLLSLLVAITYQVAICFETSFTNRIYAEAAAAKAEIGNERRLDADSGKKID